MHLLPDECVPRPLRRAFTGHVARTVPEMGWRGLRNGPLLQRIAAAGVDAFVTVDQNLRHQQNLSGRQLAVLVLPTTSWPVIRKHTATISASLGALRPGEVVELDFP